MSAVEVSYPPLAPVEPRVRIRVVRDDQMTRSASGVDVAPSTVEPRILRRVHLGARVLLWAKLGSITAVLGVMVTGMVWSFLAVPNLPLS